MIALRPTLKRIAVFANKLVCARQPRMAFSMAVRAKPRGAGRSCLATFVSRCAISTPPRFAIYYSVRATLAVFAETHRLRTSKVERDQEVSRKSSPRSYTGITYSIKSAGRDKSFAARAHSLLPSSFYPSMSLIPFAPLKLVRCPRFDSCAPAHLKLVRVPRFLAATLAALTSISLFPKAPFDLSVCPSMLLASPRLHSRSCPRHFALYVVDSRSPDRLGRIPTDQCSLSAGFPARRIYPIRSIRAM